MFIGEVFGKRRKLIALCGIALATILALGLVGRGRSSAPQYFTAAVRRGEITAAVQATGTITPLTTVPVGVSVSGTVQYVFADLNTRVRAGQVLAQLDPALYQAQVIQARGNLENAQANLRTLQASVAAMQAAVQTNHATLARLRAAADYARANAARVANLFQQGILAQDQHDLTQANLQQAEAQVRTAEAQLQQSQAQLSQSGAKLLQARAQVEVVQGALKQAEPNLRYTTIHSPIDGTVVARNITAGQSVAASLHAPNAFTIAQDLKRMQVCAKTDESDTGQIKIGTDATFKVDAFPTETFHGRVSAIQRNASGTQNVASYDTVIDFENPDERLLPGETAYVTIPTGHASGVLKIPSTALRFKPMLPQRELQALYAKHKLPATAAGQPVNGWQVVWKLGKNRVLQPVAVKVGITDYRFAQLLEGDLKEGDLLVTGQWVTRRPVSSPATALGGRRTAAPGH